jgi:transposase InsO family protein
MDLGRYLVDAVVVEGRSYRDVAKAHGVSKSLVGKLVTRFRSGGYEAIVPRSKAPLRTPHRTSDELEDRIVALRKELVEAGFDAGAQTLHYHLAREIHAPPSISTIWRVLRRRGFVSPQPHKRPRSSWIRFEAQLANECWQSDVTAWKLADGTDVEIIDVIDDHSRLCVASRAVRVAKANDVVAILREAGERLGFPASLLTDNGRVYTTWTGGGPGAVQIELLERGIAFKHSRPYHPQTCGKVERFHQTLKVFLAKQQPAKTVERLQADIDRFISYYNQIRPHRARDRVTPQAAWDVRDKARPGLAPLKLEHGARVRTDRISKAGNVTLRYRTRLHHIGVGKDHVGKRVLLLVDDLDVRIVAIAEGELLRHLTLDPDKDYQGRGVPPGPPRGRFRKSRPERLR